MFVIIELIDELIPDEKDKEAVAVLTEQIADEVQSQTNWAKEGGTVSIARYIMAQ